MRGKLFLVMIIILVLTSQIVFSISASPPKYSIKYAPGKERVFGFNFGSKGDISRFIVSLEGSLAKHANITPTALMLGGGKGQSVTVHLKQPETLGHGTHTLFVKVTTDMAYDKEKNKNMGMAVAEALKTRISVKVPYPGEHISAKLLPVKSNRVEVGGLFLLVANIDSLGQTTIDKIDGTLYVTGVGDTIVQKFPPITNLAGGDKSSIKLALDTTNMSVGRYQARASFTYGSENKIVNTSHIRFLVGKEDLEFNSKNITLVSGKINKLVLSAKSVWNEKMEFSGELIVKDEEGKVLEKEKSPNYFISAWSTNDFVIFFDATDLEAGIYAGLIRLRFGLGFGKTEKEFPVKVIVVEPKKEKPGTTQVSKSVEIAKPVKNTEGFPWTVVVVIGIGIALVLGIYFWKKKWNEEW